MSGKNTFRFGIGRKIQIGVVIVVLLPMIIGGSVSYYIYRNQQKASAISNLQDFASECGKDISYYINTQFEGLFIGYERIYYRHKSITFEFL